MIYGLLCVAFSLYSFFPDAWQPSVGSRHWWSQQVYIAHSFSQLLQLIDFSVSAYQLLFAADLFSPVLFNMHELFLLFRILTHRPVFHRSLCISV
ncbi:hypothetical protein C8J56DRAFT_268859 [Mycena floridula]|nr:hypothetical protein C8J56DRAFT_401802 [Mycena floridula]KAJ7580642.1 hypothetical protein C8J56DRAFT_268859 [Mycena floridula]